MEKPPDRCIESIWTSCICAIMCLILDFGFLWASVFYGGDHVYVYGSVWTCIVIVDVSLLSTCYHGDCSAIRWCTAIKMVCASAVLIGALVLSSLHIKSRIEEKSIDVMDDIGAAKLVIGLVFLPIYMIFCTLTVMAARAFASKLRAEEISEDEDHLYEYHGVIRRDKVYLYV